MQRKQVFIRRSSDQAIFNRMKKAYEAEILGLASTQLPISSFQFPDPFFVTIDMKMKDIENYLLILL